MKNHYSLFLFCWLLIQSLDGVAQSPGLIWQQSLGGSNYERANAICSTPDGGYVVAGSTLSNDGNVSGNHGATDFWIAKLTASGSLVWQKTLGGSNDDGANAIIATPDGGVVVAGTTASSDGNVVGKHGGLDYWVVKLDASGNLVWQKTLGGGGDDSGNAVTPTTDGGFVVAGLTYSGDGDVSGNHGGGDYWVVKLNASGNLVWQQSLGGTDRDVASTIKATSDGGYVVAGNSYSNDGDVTGNHDSADYWIVKLTASGSLVWQKTLGGSNDDIPYALTVTSDGGYAVAGYTLSNDGNVSGSHGNTDFWIVKLTAAGSLVWQKTLGGSNEEDATAISPAADGGVVVAGFTLSTDGDVTGKQGGYDYWVIKLTASGNLVWQKCLGGSGNDFGSALTATSDGGYVAGGYSYSNNGDVSGNHGSADYWVVKLGVPTLTGFAATSNPVCVGSPITFTATVGNVSPPYAFTLTNSPIGAPTGTTMGNASSTAFSQVLTASGNGPQTFTLTVNDGGSSASATTSVTVNVLPVAGLTNNGPLTCAQTSVTLTAGGGTSYTFTSPGGAVLGTSGATTTRVVSSPGSYSVRVGNPAGCVSTTSTTVISNTAVVTVSNPATSTATVGQVFSQSFTASGGAVPFSFSLASGTLPDGLSLNPATGVLSGTPTQAGSYSIAVRATNASGCAGVGTTYALGVNAATRPAIAGFSVSPNTVCVNSPVSFTARVDNVSGSYSYTLTNGGSPLTGTTSTTAFSQSLTAGGSGVKTYTLTISSGGQTAAAVTSLTVGQAGVTRLYVKANATGTNTGLSWQDAFTDLQSALKYPCTGSLREIWIARGVYKPQSGAISDAFSMLPDVAIYGGFEGTETALSQRPPITLSNPSSTTLSADIDGDGTVLNNSRYIIYNTLRLTSTAILDGAVITDPLSGTQTAAIMNFSNGNPQLGFGSECSPQFRNLLFTGYVTGQLFVSSSGIFVKNNASLGGTTSPSFVNCVFRDNQGNQADINNSPSINTQISSNGSSANLTFTNCVFANSTGPQILNLQQVGNAQIQNRFINCSFLNLSDGVLYNRPQSNSPISVELSNSVLWNTGGSNTFRLESGSQTITAQYSLLDQAITGYTSGPGNLTATSSPFVSASDLNLPNTSPAVNTGNPASVTVASAPYSATNLPATDAAANPRIVSSRVDMGAVEVQNPVAPTPIIAGLTGSPNPVCAGSPVSFTATVGNVTGSYDYTLTNGSTPISGTATGNFSQSLTASGSGSQSFTLTVRSGATLATAVTSLTITSSPDYQPLVDLYNATNGSGWNNHEGWLSGCDPCTGNNGGPWSGVQCHNGRVTYIDLLGRNLTGSLPVSLSGLTSLGHLNLYNNAITGSIPASLSALTALNYLSISYNHLTGSIPAGLGNLTNLSFLDFQQNQLSGCFPASLTVLCGRDVNFSGNPNLPRGGDFSVLCQNLPTASASTTTPSVRVGQTVSLSATGGDFYNWSGPANFTATVANPSFVASSTLQSGTYSVTVSNGSCEGNPTASVSLTVAPAPPCGSVVYVTQTGAGLQDGSSWTNAFSGTALQTAINTAANCGAQVWVAQGLYKPTTGTDRTISFSMKEGVAIYGGFVGNEAQLSDRPLINPVTGQPGSSTLSGDIGIPGDEGQNSDNSFHLFFNNSTLTKRAILDGFVLTLASASYQENGPGRGFGGAIFNSGRDNSSSPSIRNCLFVKNFSDDEGGAIYTLSSSLTVDSCRFENNRGNLRGGAMAFSSGGSPVVKNSSFLNNFSYGEGGVFYIDGPVTLTVQNSTMRTNQTNSGGVLYAYGNNGSRVEFTDCLIEGQTAEEGGVMNIQSFTDVILTRCQFLSNKATNGSSGVLYIGRGNLTATDCLFKNNSATGEAGAIYCQGDRMKLTNCSFQDNSSQSIGGALSVNCPTTLINCSFTGNKAYQGGAIFCDDLPIINCSFLANQADQGGAIYSEGGDVQLVNSILWNNGGANSIVVPAYEKPVAASYSLLEPGVTNYSDEGNNLTTTLTPFVSTTSTQLRDCSPAINTGSNAAYSSANGPATDLAGNPRFFNNGIIDRGAYEYQGTPTTLTVSNPAVSTATVGQAFSQPFTASGGSGSYSFSVVSSNLPASLSVSGTGVLSGTPTVAGSYSVLVSAQDQNGCVGVASAAYSLTVNPAAPLLPTITGFAVSPQAVCVGSPVTFTATIENIAGNYSWSLSNGGPPVVSPSPTTATAFSVVQTAIGSGVQTFTLTVTSGGQVVTAMTSVTVNVQPVATLSANGESTLSCAQTSLTLTADVTAGGPGADYWFAGPGLVSQNATSGTAVVNVAGLYSVTVTNRSGCSATASTLVSQDNTAPTASLVSSGTLSCAVTSVTLTANPNGLSYVFSAGATQLGTSNQATVSAVGPYSVTVISSNGCSGVAMTTVLSNTVSVTSPMTHTATQGVAFSQPFIASGGTSPYNVSVTSGSLPTGLSLSPTGVVSGTPTQAGSFVLTVRATDANGCSAVSSPYSLTISEPVFVGALRLIQPLYDCQSGAITFRTVGGDGSPIEFRAIGVTDWMTNPSQTVDLPVRQDPNSQPLLLQARQSGFMTTYTFDFRLYCSGTVPNQPPVFTQPPTQTATVGVAFSYRIPDETFRDLNGTAVNFGVGLLPTGLVYNSVTRIISGTATSVGTYSVMLTVSDPQSLSATGTLMIMVQPAPVVEPPVSGTLNHAPVFHGPLAAQSGVVGQAFSYSLPTGVFTDPDAGDGLSYSATGLPEGLSFNPVTQVISGTPATTGTSSVTLTATDTGSLSASGLLSVAISGSAVVPPPPTGPGTLAVIQPLYDCQTGAITFRTTGGDGSPIYFSCIGVVGYSTGVNYIVDMAIRNDANSQPLLIKATQNGVLASYTFDFRLYCTSGVTAPPVFVGPLGPVSGTVGVGLSYQLPGAAFTSPGGGALNYTVDGLPVGLSFATATGLVSGTAIMAGSYTAVVTAHDPFNQSATGNLVITIAPVPVVVPPVSGSALVLVAPLYDCGTGSFTFQTTGGDGNPIEYFAVGITGWTTVAGPYMVRPAGDAQPFTLKARQSGVEVRYVWDFKTICGSGARQGEEVVEPWTAQLLGNPVSGALVVAITGAAGQSLELQLRDVSGHVVVSRRVLPVSTVHREEVDVSAQGPGMWLLQVSGGGRSQTLKVIKP